MKGRANDHAQKGGEERTEEARPVPRSLRFDELAEGIDEPVRKTPDRIDDRILNRHGAGVTPSAKNEKTPENGGGGKNEKLQ